MPIRPTHILLLAAVALGACGTRGPLTLPPPQQKPAPAASKTPQPASVPVDTNMTKDSAR